VLGGYSQGAAVMGFVTSAAIPDGVDAADVPKPMPADVANHVAAVTLFGAPSNRFMDDGGDWAAHAAYADDGMVDRAANFAASHL
jgi:cutinase